MGSRVSRQHSDDDGVRESKLLELDTDSPGFSGKPWQKNQLIWILHLLPSFGKIPLAVPSELTKDRIQPEAIYDSRRQESRIQSVATVDP